MIRINICYDTIFSPNKIGQVQFGHSFNKYGLKLLNDTTHGQRDPLTTVNHNRHSLGSKRRNHICW